MKQIHYGVLAAMSVASVISANVQADSLQGAIKGGTFSGGLLNTLELSSDTDASGAGANNNANVLGSALTLGYLTGNYEGFTLGVGTETGYDWGLQDNDILTTAGGEDDARATINTTNLYRAFVNYRFDKNLTDSQIRVGRQKIVSPLVMTSGMFPMQDSFDGVFIENRDIKDTIVSVMYLTEWNTRFGKDNNGSLTQIDKSFDKPLLSLYVDNKSIKNLNVKAQWFANHNDENAGDGPTAATAKNYEVTYLAFSYNVPDSSWLVGAKTLSAYFEDSEDTGYWGAFAKKTINGVGIKLAQTSVKDVANFPATYGHVSIFNAYNPGMQAEYFAGMTTTSLTADYDFKIPDLKATLGYTVFQQSAEGLKNSRDVDIDGGSEISLRIDYKFQNIKGLYTRIQLSHINFDQKVEKDSLTVLRTALNYQF